MSKGRAEGLHLLADWIHQPQSAKAVAWVRIGLGLTMLWTYLFYLPHLEVMFGAEGLAQSYHGHSDLPLSARFLWPIYGLLILSALAFTLGFKATLAGLVLALCHALFLEQTRYHTWGWSRIMVVFLIYVALARPGATLSLDAWLRHQKADTAVVSQEVRGWAVRLLQLHVSLIYLSAGWARIEDPGWLQGEMMFEALNNSLYSRLPNLDLQPLKGVLWLGCWIAWILELAAPLFLWWPATRRFLAVGLIAMHLGLELTSTVGAWQLMMMSALCIFLGPIQRSEITMTDHTGKTTPE